MTLTEGKATHDCNTSSLKEGEQLPQRLVTIQTHAARRNRNRKLKCPSAQTPADVPEPDFFEIFPTPRLAASLRATNTQVNKARRKHGS